MRIDHVTHQIPKDQINDPELTEFFHLLGFKEVTPEEPFSDPCSDKEAELELLMEQDQGWITRWWIDEQGSTFHLVEGGTDTHTVWLLGHVGIFGLGLPRWQKCRESRWVVRDSGSGRLWLKGPFRIHVEVRP